MYMQAEVQKTRRGLCKNFDKIYMVYVTRAIITN